MAYTTAALGIYFLCMCLVPATAGIAAVLGIRYSRVLRTISLGRLVFFVFFSFV